MNPGLVPSQKSSEARDVAIAGALTCRVESARQERTGQDHSGGTGIIEANEQVTFPPLPGDRNPTAGHPLPDLPPDRGLPPGAQRGAYRALPQGPSRSARPPRPVAAAGRRITLGRYRRQCQSVLRDLARAAGRAPAVTPCGRPRVRAPHVEPPLGRVLARHSPIISGAQNRYSGSWISQQPE